MRFLARFIFSWSLFCMVNAQTAQGAQQLLEPCVAKAGQTLRSVALSTPRLVSLCHCVERKHGGQLPRNEQEWSSSLADKHVVSLYECGEKDLTAHHGNLLAKSAGPRLARQGFTPRQIQAFGVCTGPDAYRLARNVMVRRDGSADEADVDKLKKTIARCEADGSRS
jgi:hypothetical protein